MDLQSSTARTTRLQNAQNIPAFNCCGKRVAWTWKDYVLSVAIIAGSGGTLGALSMGSYFAIPLAVETTAAVFGWWHTRRYTVIADIGQKEEAVNRATTVITQATKTTEVAAQHLEKENDQLKIQIDQLRDEFQKNSQTSRQLESKIQEFSNENKRLKDTEIGLQQQIQQLNDQLTRFKQQEERLNGIISQLKTQTQHFDNGNKQMKSNVSDLDREFDQNVDQLNKALRAISEEAEKNKKLHEQEKAEWEQEKNRLQAASGSLESIQLAIQKETNRLSQLSSASSEANGRLEKLRLQIEQLEQQLAEKNSQLQSIVTQLGQQGNRLDHTSQGLNAVANQLEQTIDNALNKLKGSQ